MLRDLWNLGLALLIRYRAFVVYSVIGVSGATLDYLMFLLLHFPLGVGIFAANAISVSMGITNNFVLNAFLNFKTRDALLRRFVLFYGVGMLGLGLSSLLLMVFSDWLGFDVRIVKFLSIVVVVLVQYNLNKILAFGSGKKSATEPS